MYFDAKPGQRGQKGAIESSVLTEWLIARPLEDPNSSISAFTTSHNVDYDNYAFPFMAAI
jgi:hypothetical protein